MIEKVLLRDYDDNTAPPGRVLEVGLVGSRLFLTISEFSETNRESTSTRLQEICVDSRSLASAVIALNRAEEFEDQARVDDELLGKLIQALKDNKIEEK